MAELAGERTGDRGEQLGVEESEDEGEHALTTHVCRQGTLFNLFLTGINWSQMIEYMRW